MTFAPALKSYLRQAMDLHKAGDLDRAVAMYKEVLAQDPKQADALHLLGAAEWQKGNLLEAESLIRKAIAIWNKDPGYFCDLAGVLRSMGSFPDAISNFKKALALDPQHELARTAIADTYGQYAYSLAGDRPREAAAAYRELLSLRTNDASALTNLGDIYLSLGDPKKALSLFDQAIEANGELTVARYNRCICNLGLGHWERAWEDLSLSIRGWLPLMDRRHNLAWKTVPLWDGTSLEGKRILIWGDQGIGDEILVASLVPDLVSMGAIVTMECTDRLVPLFSRSMVGIRFLARHTPDVIGDQFDWQAPGLWLAKWQRPTLSAFPEHVSYLKADANKTAALRARYMNFGKKKVTGLAWHTVSGGQAQNRRVDLAELIKALPRKDVLYLDLQYGDQNDEVKDVHKQFPDLVLFKDLEVDQMRDMDAFAAAVSACDDVVTIGNTTAHMAGALGVPTKVLLPYASLTWYWLRQGSRSPWYPTLLLLRKTENEGWQPALTQLAQ